jgi:hypothetical protein
MKVRMHFIFWPPKCFGGLIIWIEPKAVDQKIGPEDKRKGSDDGEEQAFHVHHGRLANARWQGERL